MRKEGAKLLSASLLIFSTGFANPVRAENNDNHQPASENCQKAAEASGSLLTSVSKILCHEEYANDEVFSNLLRQANNLTGQRLPDLPKQEQPKQRRKTEKNHRTRPKRTAKAKRPDAHKWGRSDFAASDKSHSRDVATRKRAAPKPKSRGASAASIRQAYFIGEKLRDLSPRQRKELRSKYESLLKRKDVMAFLNSVERGEGGGLLVIVGGTRGKSTDCQRRIRRLDVSGHPKEQGLPSKCFLTTRTHGLSTAAGMYQIVYYKNWRSLRRLLALEDFSGRSQAIAALELVRSSKVRGAKLGDGLVALVRGDLDNAIRKGTDPWASSPYSRWRGRHPAPLLQYARQELRRLGNEKYALQQSRKLQGQSSLIEDV